MSSRFTNKDGKTAAEIAKEARDEKWAALIAQRAFEQRVPARAETEAEAAARRKKRREKNLLKASVHRAFGGAPARSSAVFVLS